MLVTRGRLSVLVVSDICVQLYSIALHKVTYIDFGYSWHFSLMLKINAILPNFSALMHALCSSAVRKQMFAYYLEEQICNCPSIRKCSGHPIGTGASVLISCMN